ncbi:membrane protein [Paenibacillus darwinianus]|uniref:histidine kinase n=1 Tax=Paenibacillus darwinianus TaxID=1380763 RepID=A0A9W5S1P9_9BACL|nr:sensor histidine kinase [Paenibacillus darwinianus]EXX87519.1 membrane protein [Paenibacillus darwinianus]EXX88409.1 membrane protein [Paenibacillus darwinianus]EXX88754.1 membrane protein [Paenibacillus darwinianus]
MTIRRKLLLFIPLLVLLVNSVTFFLFTSAQTVQKSYEAMTERMLLYKQAARTADDNLRLLYAYLLNPNDNGSALAEFDNARARLQEQRAALTGAGSGSLPPASLRSYTYMLGTFAEQASAARNSAAAADPRSALAHYEDAEQTTAYIREEGQRLVDLELSFYQPVFKRIQSENERMNRLAAAVFVLNTLLSVVLAVWISRSITGPVSRLVRTARQMSKGNFSVEPSPRSNDELGILSDAFERMSTELKTLIERDKESLEKDRLVKELELQALQSQINPHFLFNTLNVLAKLALLEGAERTSDLIVSMSNLMRYNLRKLDTPVTLRSELEHVKEYFAIQQARFRERIRLELDIDESALQAAIPSLTLQPIVENAFVHGIAGREEGAVIWLKIGRVPHGIRIRIADNGAGMSEHVRLALLRLEAESDNRQSTGLGTRNVFKRLQLFYGRSDLVDIDSVPGEGTAVSIVIPEEKEDENTHVSAVDRG